MKVVSDKDELEAAGVNIHLPTRYSNMGQKPTLAYLDSDVIKVRHKDRIRNSRRKEDVETDDPGLITLKTTSGNGLIVQN